MKLTTQGKIAIICTIVALAAILFSITCGKDFNDSLELKTSTIKWEEVNLRESPSTNADILTVLGEGEHITFTGNVFQYSDPAYPYDYWVEVKTENFTGWIIAKAANH